VLMPVEKVRPLPPGELAPPTPPHPAERRQGRSPRLRQCQRGGYVAALPGCRRSCCRYLALGCRLPSCCGPLCAVPAAGARVFQLRLQLRPAGLFARGAEGVHR
jgi:hypothetical protein